MCSFYNLLTTIIWHSKWKDYIFFIRSCCRRFSISSYNITKSYARLYHVSLTNSFSISINPSSQPARTGVHHEHGRMNTYSWKYKTFGYFLQVQFFYGLVAWTWRQASLKTTSFLCCFTKIITFYIQQFSFFCYFKCLGKSKSLVAECHVHRNHCTKNINISYLGCCQSRVV